LKRGSLSIPTFSLCSCFLREYLSRSPFSDG
jgi:hypothetical protein